MCSHHIQDPCTLMSQQLQIHIEFLMQYITYINFNFLLLYFHRYHNQNMMFKEVCNIYFHFRMGKCYHLHLLILSKKFDYLNLKVKHLNIHYKLHNHHKELNMHIGLEEANQQYISIALKPPRRQKM